MKKLTTRDITQIAISTAMMSLSALIIIPVGPVPVTLQVFFFLLIPALLGPFKGTITLTLYVLLGLIGLPVFAGGTGGFQSILTPSFGYLIGQVLLAPLVGYYASRKKETIPYLFGLLTLIILLLYLVGMAYQYWIMNSILATPIRLRAILAGNLFVFFPLDLAKAMGAATIYKRLINIKSFRYN